MCRRELWGNESVGRYLMASFDLVQDLVVAHLLHVVHLLDLNQDTQTQNAIAGSAQQHSSFSPVILSLQSK